MSLRPVGLELLMFHDQGCCDDLYIFIKRPREYIQVGSRHLTITAWVVDVAHINWSQITDDQILAAHEPYVFREMTSLSALPGRSFDIHSEKCRLRFERRLGMCPTGTLSAQMARVAPACLE